MTTSWSIPTSPPDGPQVYRLWAVCILADPSADGELAWRDGRHIAYPPCWAKYGQHAGIRHSYQPPARTGRVGLLHRVPGDRRAADGSGRGTRICYLYGHVLPRIELNIVQAKRIMTFP